jgi:hypothetical protein
MKKTYQHDIDVDFNKIYNCILNPISTSDRLSLTLTTSDVGYVCYDVTVNSVYFWTGINWSILAISPIYLQGLADTAISSPTNGQYLTYNGTKWVNTNLSISGLTAGGDLNGTYPNPSVVSLLGNAIPTNTNGYLHNDGNGVLSWNTVSGYVPYTGATANLYLYPYNITASQFVVYGGHSTQFLKGDGSLDTNTYLTTISGITAGGDLSGSYPNPTVAKIKGNTVPINSTGFLYNDGFGNLTWNNYSYSLPISSSSTLGGVKIGSGVNVGSDGTISVSTSYQSPLSGSGFVKISGTTISYDNSIYLTSSNLKTINLNSLIGSGDISINTLIGYTPYNSTNPSNYIALTNLSSTANGLSYSNTTGVFSLTSGYAIPTTSQLSSYLTNVTGLITTSVGNNITITGSGTSGSPYNIAVSSGFAPLLTSTYIGYGSSGGALTGSSGLTWNNTNRFLGIGTSSPTSALNINGNISASYWGTSGITFVSAANTYTDTSSISGSSPGNIYFNVFNKPTIVASNATSSSKVNYGAAANVYIDGAPIAGANVTITNSYSLYINSGNSYFGGSVTFNSTITGNGSGLTNLNYNINNWQGGF